MRARPPQGRAEPIPVSQLCIELSAAQEHLRQTTELVTWQMRSTVQERCRRSRWGRKAVDPAQASAARLQGTMYKGPRHVSTEHVSNATRPAESKRIGGQSSPG